MLSSSKFWTTLIAITPLATSSLIKRGSSVIVGYRTVSPVRVSPLLEGETLRGQNLNDIVSVDSSPTIP